jgi:hypothetical protein
MPTDLRPLSTGELLDRTFAIYRKNFLLFFAIVALPELVLFAARIGYATLNGTNIGRLPTSGNIASVAFGSLALMVLYLIIIAAAQGATVHAVSRVYLGQPTSVSESYAAVRGQLGSIVAVIIVTFILVMLGSLLLIVPGILLAIRWALVVPVAALEDAGVTESRERSSYLTQGFRGRIFLIFLMYIVLVYAISAALEVPIVTIGLPIIAKTHVVPMWYLIGVYGTTFIVGSLVGPVLVIALSLAYFDGRVRKEAFDLQVLMGASQLPGTASAAGAPRL